jgi:hypothetical protein
VRYERSRRRAERSNEHAEPSNEPQSMTIERDRATTRPGTHSRGSSTNRLASRKPSVIRGARGKKSRGSIARPALPEPPTTPPAPLRSASGRSRR